MIWNFHENAKVHYLLNEFILDIIYRFDNSEELWDVKYLNSLDRKDLAEQYVEFFLENYPEELYDNERKVSKTAIKSLKTYADNEIDRLIPKIYFLEKNKELSDKYTQILTRRIFDTSGVENLECTKDFVYAYPHTKEFKEIKKTIEQTKATEKQIQYLNDLGKSIGYLLWNEEYLSKNYANQLIEYLSEKSYVEPAIFSFFFVSK
jgi:hypothetical protein